MIDNKEPNLFAKVNPDSEQAFLDAEECARLQTHEQTIDLTSKAKHEVKQRFRSFNRPLFKETALKTYESNIKIERELFERKHFRGLQDKKSEKRVLSLGGHR